MCELQLKGGTHFGEHSTSIPTLTVVILSDESADLGRSRVANKSEFKCCPKVIVEVLLKNLSSSFAQTSEI